MNKDKKPIADFKIVVCNDGNIFFDKIEKKLNKKNSVFIGVPLRLGLNKITYEYLECLKHVFTFDSNCGIAGGQDHKSLFFVGIINP